MVHWLTYVQPWLEGSYRRWFDHCIAKLASNDYKETISKLYFSRWHLITLYWFSNWKKNFNKPKLIIKKKKRQPVKQRSDKKQPTENSSWYLVPANSYQILDYYDFNEMVPTNRNSDARTISMASELVIKACSSFHSVGKSLKIIEKYLPVETPSANSVRQWIYRLGYYELMEKPKPFRSDWIFIADFTTTVFI